MHISSSTLSLVTWTALVSFASAAPIVIHPGNIGDIVITASDTLNSSHPDNTYTNGTLPYATFPDTTKTPSEKTSVFAGNGKLSIDIVNKLPKSNLFVYISGLDTNGELVMLDQDSSYFYPTTTSAAPQPIGSNVAIPIGAPNNTLKLTLPGYMGSARIWIAEGGLKFFVVGTPTGPGLVEPAAVNPNDPNAQVNYAFAEFDWAASSGLYADISYVDFVGLPLGIELSDTQNNKFSALGVPSNAAPLLCNELKAQTARDGHPWDQMCVYNTAGDLIRVLSPQNYASMNTSAFDKYFSIYGGYVWDHFRNKPLYIDTQSGAGHVKCQVIQHQLLCQGDNRGYSLPTAADVFGCNTGPFAIEAGDNDVHQAVVPRLCAAFNRATFLVRNGEMQPHVSPEHYYTVAPSNWYSAMVHRMEVDGRGYAFPYDDVAFSNADDQSGLVASASPNVMTVVVGGS